MKVLIEAKKGSNTRIRFNESTLVEKSRHNLRREYPYCYGFAIDTGSNAEDCLDCFIITENSLTIGEVVECDPRDVFILKEGDEEDIKILAVMENDEIEKDYEKAKDNIEVFLKEVFKEWPDVSITVGPLLGKMKAVEYFTKRIKK